MGLGPGGREEREALRSRIGFWCGVMETPKLGIVEERY